MQTVGSPIERFAFDKHRIGELNRGVLIGSGAPRLAVRHHSAPDFAAPRQRTVIRNRDIGNTDALRQHGMLALPRKVKNGGLRVAEDARQQAAH